MAQGTKVETEQRGSIKTCGQGMISLLMYVAVSPPALQTMVEKSLLVLCSYGLCMWLFCRKIRVKFCSRIEVGQK